MAASLQFLLAARTCTMWRWSQVRPVWLVTTPTRLPASAAKSCSTSTSSPVFTRAPSAAQNTRFTMHNEDFRRIRPAAANPCLELQSQAELHDTRLGEKCSRGNLPEGRRAE